MVLAARGCLVSVVVTVAMLAAGPAMWSPLRCDHVLLPLHQWRGRRRLRQPPFVAPPQPTTPLGILKCSFKSPSLQRLLKAPGDSELQALVAPLSPPDPDRPPTRRDLGPGCTGFALGNPDKLFWARWDSMQTHTYPSTRLRKIVLYYITI